MKLKFSKSEMIELIEQYYKGKNQNVKAIITSKKARLGYGTWVYDGCQTTFSVIESMMLLGKRYTCENSLTKEEIENIFTTLLENANFEVISISFDSGVRNETTGYGMLEHTEKIPYFNGIIVEGNKKLEKQRERRNIK